MTKRISLALQGGGAHGAFTWGALKRILQEPDIEIAAISGTSAGALNGAAVKAGLASAEGEAGRKAAIANLDRLWRRIGAVTDPRLVQWMSMAFPDPAFVARSIAYSPFFAAADAASRAISPYAYGRFYENPLRRIVDRLAFDKIRSQSGPAFFVNATRVRDGKIRVFRASEMSADVILASACLPTIFRAVEVFDDQTGQIEEFWDGGYTASPALSPLLGEGFPDDVVIVHINPFERSDLPRSPSEIQNRINEISFNSALLRDLREISFAKRLIAEGRIGRNQMRDMNIHMISDDGLTNDLTGATKLVPRPYMMGKLREAGDRAAHAFLNAHKDRIGREGSVDLPEPFG